MSKILFKNARILKMNGEDIFISNLVTNDNLIEYIGDDYEPYGPFDRVIECNENLLMPGFKNAHTHHPMSILRSYADDLPLHEWLFDKVFPIEAKLSEEDVYEFTKLSILECFASGVTACFEYYFHYYAMLKASEEMGMRTYMLLTPSLPEEELAAIHEQYSDPEGLITTCFGLHSVYTPTPEFYEMIIRLVNKYHTPFYIHASETPNEVKECMELRNMTPVQFVESMDLFKYGGGIYHGVVLNDNDYEIIKKHNLTVVTCPGSNTKLASGIADTEKMVKSNVNVAIGTDGPASNNGLDMFKEMWLVTGLQKLLHNDPSAMDAKCVLEMATINGAKAMNLTNSDILEVNKFADIILIDLNKPNMRPIHNIVKNLVYSGSKDVVKLTMVDGKIVYEDGKFYVNQDVDEIYKKCQYLADKLTK